jgi:hypothetical protein
MNLEEISRLKPIELWGSYKEIDNFPSRASSWSAGQLSAVALTYRCFEL